MEVINGQVVDCFGPYGHFLAVFTAFVIFSLLGGGFLTLILGPYKDPPYPSYRLPVNYKPELAIYTYILIFGIIGMVIVIVLATINEQVLPPQCYMR